MVGITVPLDGDIEIAPGYFPVGLVSVARGYTGLFSFVGFGACFLKVAGPDVKIVSFKINSAVGQLPLFLFKVEYQAVG